MSHYRNVAAILEAIETRDQVALAELIRTSDPEVLADDICYFGTKLLAVLSHHERTRLTRLFLSDQTDYEIEHLEEILGDTESTQ